MSRAWKTWIRIAVAGILFLLLSGSASAAVERILTAGCPSRTDAKVVARWNKNKVDMTLFLPGCWDLSKITLELEDTGTLFLGEERFRVEPGEPADLTSLLGQHLKVYNDQDQGRGYLTIMQGSPIAALFLEVDENQLKRINYSKENQITEGRAVYAEADGTVSYDGVLDQLRARGNNSFLYSKKPYQLKLHEKASLSGTGKGKTWVLLANWVDISLLRNQIVLDLCRQTGQRYAISCVQADVWINGSYNGLYTMTEKIQIGKNRIDITNLEKATEAVNPSPFDPGQIFKESTGQWPLLRSYPDVKDPEDITGGYIFTVEKKHRLRDKPLAGFRTDDELSIRIKEPTYPSRNQAAWLYDRVREMQKALMASDGVNGMTGRSYEEIMDTTSFAQRFLIEDWTKNYDFIAGSQFMYKDSDRADPKIYAGPSWDYDLCFGNMKDRGYGTGGAYVTGSKRNLNLYWLLYNHQAFREQVRELWRKDFRSAVAVLLGDAEAGPDSVIRSLDEYKERISASAAMNYKRWPINSAATGRGSGGSFDNSVEYLKRWIRERTAWMDGEYGR